MFLLWLKFIIEQSVLKREKVIIDNKSGVSARMSITAYENLLARQNVALLELVMIKQPYVCRLYGYHTFYYG
jgi:hypothetical protein